MDLVSLAGFLEENGYHVNGIGSYRDNEYSVKLSSKNRDKPLTLSDTAQFLEASGFTVKDAEELYYEAPYPVVVRVTFIKATA